MVGIRSLCIERSRTETFSAQGHCSLVIDGVLPDPESMIEHAILQKFAKITPQYPGIRAPLDKSLADQWAEELSPLLSSTFGYQEGRWAIQAWHSIVTKRPDELLPIQCLPHVDGTDPDQIAMMLYLHRTGHGGTAFFRQKWTGLEALTDETFPRYKAALEADVAKTGLPQRRYLSDGEPHFERTHVTEGAFNQAVFYHGNLLHSGMIDNAEDLSPHPAEGRYTINAFLRPPQRS